MASYGAYFGASALCRYKNLGKQEIKIIRVQNFVKLIVTVGK